MNKKALVLAIGAALAIPCALAQKGGGANKDDDSDSVVVLYGKIYPEIVREKGKDATPASCTIASGCLATFAQQATGSGSIITRNEMESSNSRFGVRGHERLGRELRAIWQLETEFHVDSNDSRFAQRDSYVGLKHDKFGTVKLGRFDTPFKEYGDDISFLGVSSGNFVSTSSILRWFGIGTSNTARFHERGQNAVQYESPDWPLNFKVQYNTNETDTAQRHRHMWSFGVGYEWGNLKLLAGHEIHWDALGLSNNVGTSAMSNSSIASTRSKDKASEVAIVYKLGNHELEADYEWHEWKEFGQPGSTPLTALGKVGSYKNNSYLLNWQARWSPKFRTQVHYVHATAGECSRTFILTSAPCITDGLDGSQISVGAAYYFSRKTYLFFLWQQLRNGKSSVFASGSQAPSTGEDVTQVAIGMNTTF
ncbi:MAG TPA: porin [Usitatibacter sp.]|jgi:predicted porin|nr:porin [Usitatibacter sp.]